MQQLLQNIFSDNTLFILLFHFNSDKRMDKCFQLTVHSI